MSAFQHCSILTFQHIIISAFQHFSILALWHISIPAFQDFAGLKEIGNMKFGKNMITGSQHTVTVCTNERNDFTTLASARPDYDSGVRQTKAINPPFLQALQLFLTIRSIA